MARTKKAKAKAKAKAKSKSATRSAASAGAKSGKPRSASKSRSASKLRSAADAGGSPRPAAKPQRARGASVSQRPPVPRRSAPAAASAVRGAVVPPPSWPPDKEPKSPKDRRRQPRAEAQFNVRLYGGDGRDTYLEAKLCSADVSLSGIFLRSTFFLPIGVSVRIEFEVPGVGPVRADGEVRRVQREGEGAGFGIEFNSFAEGSLEALVSVFVADEVRSFVEQYCRQRRGQADVPTSTSLLHGILAWEIHRSGAARSA